MDRLTIVKVGGEIIKTLKRRKTFLTDFSLIQGNKLLIHGGGSILTELAESLKIETRMIDGRRVTSEELLKLAVMAYAGLVNKELVVELQALRINSLGLTGADANLILSSKRPTKPIDYGLVGDIQAVNTPLIKDLLGKGYTPVLAPITHNGQGQLLNTNADNIAGETAQGLADSYNVRLIYCFDKQGVLYDEKDDCSIIDTLSYANFQKYKKKGIIRGGMLPKLENAFKALSLGVQDVIITSASNVCKNGCGTLLQR